MAQWPTSTRSRTQTDTKLEAEKKKNHTRKLLSTLPTRLEKEVGTSCAYEIRGTNGQRGCDGWNSRLVDKLSMKTVGVCVRCCCCWCWHRRGFQELAGCQCECLRVCWARFDEANGRNVTSYQQHHYFFFGGARSLTLSLDSLLALAQHCFGILFLVVVENVIGFTIKLRLNMLCDMTTTPCDTRHDTFDSTATSHWHDDEHDLLDWELSISPRLEPLNFTWGSSGFSLSFLSCMHASTHNIGPWMNRKKERCSWATKLRYPKKTTTSTSTHRQIDCRSKSRRDEKSFCAKDSIVSKYLREEASKMNSCDFIWYIWVKWSNHVGNCMCRNLFVWDEIESFGCIRSLRAAEFDSTKIFKIPPKEYEEDIDAVNLHLKGFHEIKNERNIV